MYVTITLHKSSQLYSDTLTARPRTAEPNLRHSTTYRGADKSLARPGSKKLGSMSGTRAISRRELSSSLFFFFLQGKAPKKIHAILTETLDCFLPGRAKDLKAHLYVLRRQETICWSRNSPYTMKSSLPHIQKPATALHL